jgi:Asp-tRNA(Asn)/Glu-tRNA(Gln) amidotransferase A subunit family amidase
MLERLSLLEMAAAVRERKISAKELVEAHLAQIERVNAGINAFVTVRSEEARREAALAGAATSNGPLFGVPVSIKDSFDVTGLPTRAGSLLNPPAPATRDAIVVDRLRRAGAIVIGKTNTPDLLSSYDTDSFITGRTNNPCNPEHTPGGSSGGEAAAIASYCSAGGVGSDGGGSIRIPAHFCGIAGLKPTPGRIPPDGHTPPVERPPGLLSAMGPMARSAADLQLLFQVLAGAARPVSTVDRVGVVRSFNGVPVHPAISAALDRAAAILERIGTPVTSFQPRGIERAPNLWNLFFGVIPARETAARIAGRESEVHWTATENLARYLELPLPGEAEIRQALLDRETMRQSLADQMQDVQILLTPPSSIPAFRHRERRFEVDGKRIGLFQAMFPATTFNLLGFPALVIPFGHSDDGLPVGVQLVGRPFEEETLLDFAVKLERLAQ